jgi:Fe-S-cluster-containing dehydrogenase component/DMSO reductase anchor subunit
MSLHGSINSTPVLYGENTSLTVERNSGLVDLLLDEQGDLTAVQRFAQFHEDAVEPLQERYYRALLPATPPGPGQQLAFEVDLDRCSGCKACVAACHNLNGLDPGESWRDVGLVLSSGPALPVLQHVTAACHHCVDPACLTACPVDAYEKDPLTGIVQHLDDQCFGCQYCTLACPYDAPKFHAAKGIVRKCDMCSGRLAMGEAPACVQSCPHEAIRIRVVDQSKAQEDGQSRSLLQTGPDGAHTRPTTVYRSRRLPGPRAIQSADLQGIEPEPPHWPLITMLILTQCAVGVFNVKFLLLALGRSLGPADSTLTILALAACWAGLGASLFHLGRPLYAYRAVLGISHSWLSREILALGLFAKLAAVFAAIELCWPTFFLEWPHLRFVLLGAVAVTGIAGIACSVMVYHAVRRPFWHAFHGAIKFGGTSLVLGLALVLAADGAVSAQSSDLQAMASPSPFCFVAFGLAAASSMKLLLESRLVHRCAKSELAALRTTARLLGGPLQRPAGLRRFLGVVGGVVLPAWAVLSASSAVTWIVAACAVLALAVSAAGEIAERYLFFTAVVSPRVPGGLS